MPSVPTRDARIAQYVSNTSVFLEDEAPFTARAAKHADEPPSAPLGKHERLGPFHSYTLELGGGHGAWQQLQQHVVDGRPVMPGSGYVSWALQVLLEHGPGASLSDVRFLRVLDLVKPRTVTLTLTAEPNPEDSAPLRGGETSGLRGTIQIT